ncbi:MAG: flagellar hook-length control protein FliK [bacterium]
MDIKNKMQIKSLQEKNLDKKENQKIPSSDEFQKEIDKKINKDNKDKKQTNNKEEKLEKSSEEKQKTDTKDLTTLKLFVLPYMNKDIVSVNLKDFVEKDPKNIKTNLTNLEQQEKLNLKTQINQSINTKEEKDKKSATYNIEFNPFSSFDKLNNSLKEITKTEKVKESSIIKELISNLDVQKLKEGRMVEIKFDKENVGALSVQIVTKDNKVSVMFKTSSKFIYDQLKSNKELLKEMLESRNLKSDEIIIDYEEVI